MQRYNLDSVNNIQNNPEALRDARKQTHDLLEELRTMNQDGLDLYGKGMSSSEYQDYFEDEQEKAKKKCGH